MKNIPLAPTLAVLLALGALAWWLINFERVPETAYVGLSGKAREDPYLAFKRLLAASGMRHDEVAATVAPDTTLATLAPAGTLILLARREVLMSPQRIGVLLQWVAAGGHLIVAAEPVARADPLLTALGVSREMMRGPERAATGATPAPSPAPSAVVPNTRLVDLKLPGASRALKIEINSPTILKTENVRPDWQAADARGVRLLSQKRGAGRVTIAADLGWITYRGRGQPESARPAHHIGKFDHAEAIVGLIRQDSRPSAAGVRILGGRSGLSLWRWLADNAWAALTGCALLLAFWLWRIVPRFGPLATPPADPELRLASHLEASGRFYRQHMPTVEIHQGLRRAFLQRLAEKRPGIAARVPAERNTELARVAGVKAQAVARALDHPVDSTGDFVRATILIKRLEQAI